MNRKCFFLPALLLSLSLHAFRPENGDLVFQIAGSSAFSDAIVSATGSHEEYDYIHVGIIQIQGDTAVYVIEASPEAGVRSVEMKEFLDASPKIDGKPGVVVKRLVTDFSTQDAISNALSHLGEPYDWYYMPDNGRMYCSELVYDSFLYPDGTHIFTVNPMNFKDRDGHIPDFWIDLYKDLGVDIPENQPGTNPNDLSKDPVLIDIHHYF